MPLDAAESPAWTAGAIADALVATGWWTDAAAIDAGTAIDLRTSAQHHLAVHGRPAGVGRHDGHVIDARIRGDRIAWIDQTAPVALGRWLRALEGLAAVLRPELRLPLAGIEAMVACYPPGAGYERHVDQHRGVGARLVTCIAYLNPDWQAGHGGELELWPDGGEESVLVAPTAGRVVLLRADLPHAVRAARRERYSLTAWLRRDDASAPSA